MFVSCFTVINDLNATTLVTGGLSSILEQIQLEIIRRVNRGQICDSEGVGFALVLRFHSAARQTRRTSRFGFTVLWKKTFFYVYTLCFLRQRAVTEKVAWSDVASWRAGCLRNTISRTLWWRAASSERSRETTSVFTQNNQCQHRERPRPVAKGSPRNISYQQTRTSYARVLKCTER